MLPPDVQLTDSLFQTHIFPYLGSSHDTVIPASSMQFPVSFIRAGDHDLALSIAPITCPERIPPQAIGYYSLNKAINVFMQAGIIPSAVSVDLHCPAEWTESDMRIFWRTLSESCRKYDITCTAHYIGWQPKSDRQSLWAGSIAVTGIVSGGRSVTPAGAQNGDSIIITGNIAGEAAGVAAWTIPKTLSEAVGDQTVLRTQNAIYNTCIHSTITALYHDDYALDDITSFVSCNERGLSGALHYLSIVSKKGIHIDEVRVPLSGEAMNILKVLNINPFEAASAGSMIITCRPHKKNELVRIISQRGIIAEVIGEVRDTINGVHVIRSGVDYKLPCPESDAFWSRYREYCIHHEC